MCKVRPYKSKTWFLTGQEFLAPNECIKCNYNIHSSVGVNALDIHRLQYYIILYKVEKAIIVLAYMSGWASLRSLDIYRRTTGCRKSGKNGKSGLLTTMEIP